MANSRSSTVLADQLGTLYCLGAVGRCATTSLWSGFWLGTIPRPLKLLFAPWSTGTERWS